MCVRITACVICACVGSAAIAQRHLADSFAEFPELEIGCGEAESPVGSAAQRGGVPIPNLLTTPVTARSQPRPAQQAVQLRRWSPRFAGRDANLALRAGNSLGTFPAQPVATTGRVRRLIASPDIADDEDQRGPNEQPVVESEAYPYPPITLPEQSPSSLGEPQAAQLSTALPEWFVWEQAAQQHTVQRRAYVPGDGPRSGSTLPLPANVEFRASGVPSDLQTAPRSGALRYLRRGFGRRCW